MGLLKLVHPGWSSMRTAAEMKEDAWHWKGQSSGSWATVRVQQVQLTWTTCEAHKDSSPLSAPILVLIVSFLRVASTYFSFFNCLFVFSVPLLTLLPPLQTSPLFLNYLKYETVFWKRFYTFLILLVVVHGLNFAWPKQNQKQIKINHKLHLTGICPNCTFLSVETFKLGKEKIPAWLLKSHEEIIFWS